MSFATSCSFSKQKPSCPFSNPISQCLRVSKSGSFRTKKENRFEHLTMRTICKLNSLNPVSDASCCIWPAPAATTNTNGTGAVSAANSLNDFLSQTTGTDMKHHITALLTGLAVSVGGSGAMAQGTASRLDRGVVKHSSEIQAARSGEISVEQPRRDRTPGQEDTARPWYLNPGASPLMAAWGMALFLCAMATSQRAPARRVAPLIAAKSSSQASKPNAGPPTT